MTGFALPRFVTILGVRVHDLTMAEALAHIERFVSSESPHLVVTLGTEMVMAAQGNREFRRIINEASLVLPDGGGLIWASRRLGDPLREKVAGIDVLCELCRLSGSKGWKIFFLGGKPGVAETAAANIRVRFPEARIVGTHHGYFEDREVLPILEKARPEIVCAGMGFPRQERWLSTHLPALGIPVGMGVGGSFDVLGGKLKRAPPWMRDLNLEWLFRFVQEPRRLKRIFSIPLFMGKIWLQRHSR